MQTRWKSLLDILLANKITQGQMITGVSLINGAVTFNHLLGRKMIGWIIVDVDAAATIYRSQPLNDITLTLTSNAVATVNLWVF